MSKKCNFTFKENSMLLMALYIEYPIQNEIKVLIQFYINTKNMYYRYNCFFEFHMVNYIPIYNIPILHM